MKLTVSNIRASAPLILAIALFSRQTSEYCLGESVLRILGLKDNTVLNRAKPSFLKNNINTVTHLVWLVLSTKNMTTEPCTFRLVFQWCFAHTKGRCMGGPRSPLHRHGEDIYTPRVWRYSLQPFKPTSWRFLKNYNVTTIRRLFVLHYVTACYRTRLNVLIHSPQTICHVRITVVNGLITCP